MQIGSTSWSSKASLVQFFDLACEGTFELNSKNATSR
jgi:hypothetical protein